MAQYLPLLVMLILGGLFAGISFLANSVMAPKKPTPAKLAPYESGIVPEREPPTRFPVRFYLVAMIFIVIDIEIIFLYPWAVIYRSLGAYGLWAMVLFGALVFESFVYLLGKGALNWGPPKRLRPVAPEGAVSHARTTGTTIRRVGSAVAATPGEAA
jgi:NADH-quinone oxidoreductase subunit A